MTEKYKNYEFCKAINCIHYYPTNRFEKENCSCVNDCIYTAKDFHNWLIDNNFEIIKRNISIKEIHKRNYGASNER